MILRTLPLIVSLVLLTACSTDQQTLTAEQMVAELAQRIPTAEPGLVFTAENDPYAILGRPGGYTSKASFTDTRIPAEKTTGAIKGAAEYGGSVEVFPDNYLAQRRKDYLDGVSSNQLAMEYSWVSGPVLLRVSQHLTPDQAAEYQTALTEIG